MMLRSVLHTCFGGSKHFLFSTYLGLELLGGRVVVFSALGDNDKPLSKVELVLRNKQQQQQKRTKKSTVMILTLVICESFLICNHTQYCHFF